MSKMLKSIKKVVKEYKKQLLIIFLVSVFLCLIDQLTKWLAVYFLGPLITYPSSNELPFQQGNSVEVIPGLLNFTLLTNNGAAFGMGSGTIIARVIFIIISWLVFLGVPIFIIYYYKKNKHQFNILNLLCLILIYGGNFGNLIDRTFYWDNPCGVIDFIDVTPLIPNFGIFNIADSFVVIGVIILLISLIIDIFKGEDNKKKEQEELKNIKENKTNSNNLVENNDKISNNDNSLNKENNSENGKEISN